MLASLPFRVYCTNRAELFNIDYAYICDLTTAVVLISFCRRHLPVTVTNSNYVEYIPGFSIEYAFRLLPSHRLVSPPGNTQTSSTQLSYPNLSYILTPLLLNTFTPADAVNPTHWATLPRAPPTVLVSSRRRCKKARVSPYPGDRSLVMNSSDEA